MQQAWEIYLKYMGNAIYKSCMMELWHLKFHYLIVEREGYVMKQILW